MSTKANKPQWLLDAEKAIQNFEDSKYGKMTDKQMRLSERGRINGSMADRSKITKSRLETLANNPEFQKKLSDAGKFTTEKLKEKGHYQSEQWIEASRKNGKKLQASMTAKEKTKLGQLANSSRTEEGKSKAGKARAAATNSIRIKCPHCHSNDTTPGAYKRYHGDSCMWIKHSEEEVFGSIEGANDGKPFNRKQIREACKKYSIIERRAIHSEYIIKIQKGLYKIK